MGDLILVLILWAIIAIALTMIVRHGPVANRWWRGENPIGFALFVALIAFCAGFFGPIIFFPEANQGPLIGFLYTGPAGVIVGVVWGLIREARRRYLRPPTGA